MLEHPRILKPNQSYTFDGYFELRFAPAEILADLGVKLQKATIDLPVSPASEEQLGRYDRLNQTIHQDLKLYRVPTDLNQLLPHLVGILRQE